MLYDSWCHVPVDQQEGFASEMESSYRLAWHGGSLEEKQSVLAFICNRPEPGGFDLVIDGINDPDVALARIAVALAQPIFGKFDLGPDAEKSLEEFGKRFPDDKILSDVALMYLHNNFA